MSLESYAQYFGRAVPDVRQDLEILLEILAKWQRVQNLVSRETADLWTRHVLDSLQLLPLILAPNAENPRNISVKKGGVAASGAPNWVDMGSGGGFPALPLSIALKNSGITYHLLESNGRKCAFLNAVKRELDLPIVVHNVRIEAIDPRKFGDVALITARALAPLPLLMEYMLPIWRPATRALLHKGREYGEECKQADSLFRFDMVNHPSRADPEGVILEITRLERKPAQGEATLSL